MYLLDTNVVSELRKAAAGRAHAGVVEWAASAPTELTFISAITIQELEHGVLLAERRDAAAGDVLRHWIDHDVHDAFDARVLPVDAVVARTAAGLHVPDPAPVEDALIAATALVHGMAVVTRNAVDFERFGRLEVVNPWSHASRGI